MYPELPLDVSHGMSVSVLSGVIGARTQRVCPHWSDRPEPVGSAGPSACSPVASFVPAVVVLRVARGSVLGPAEPAALTPGGLYLNIESTVDPTMELSPAAAEQIDIVLHTKLTALGARLAPPHEDKPAALALIRANNLQGYELRLQVLPGAAQKSLKVQLLVMSYPEHASRGNWSVTASGAKPEALIKAMVPRVLEDAAGDLGWKE